MRWFKHLTNASSDFKILSLERQYGHLGYAFYWKTVEMIASQWSGFGDPEIETTFSYYRQFLRTQEPKVKKILEVMRTLDLVEYRIEGEKLILRMDAMKSIRDNSSAKSSDNKGIKRELKEYLVKRDLNKCVYCDVSLLGQTLNKVGPKFGQFINFDHFIPVALGGKSEASNLVCSCVKCNGSKGMAHPDEIELGGYSFSNKIPKIRQMLALELESESEIELDKEKESRAVQTTKQKSNTALNSKIWESYRDAYSTRYGVEPIRNASVNGKISQIGKRLGEEAPDIVRFFVFHNDSYLIKNTHAIGLCLAQAESMATQWRTGKQITQGEIKRFERAQVFDTMKKDAEAGGF